MKVIKVPTNGLIASVILGVSVFGIWRLCPANDASTSENQDPAVANMILGYKQWKKANLEPQLMDLGVAALCATLTASRLKLDKLNPHKENYLTVYVNKTGYDEFMTKKIPHFAEGTVIVKEKLGASTNTTPELLTVMIKRHAGFNPTDGDWEYLVFGGHGLKVTARGKIQSCEECHETRQAEDYVFRSYLTSIDSKALK